MHADLFTLFPSFHLWGGNDMSLIQGDLYENINRLEVFFFGGGGE